MLQDPIFTTIITTIMIFISHLFTTHVHSFLNGVKLRKKAEEFHIFTKNHNIYVNFPMIKFMLFPDWFKMTKLPCNASCLDNETTRSSYKRQITTKILVGNQLPMMARKKWQTCQKWKECQQYFKSRSVKSAKTAPFHLLVKFVVWYAFNHSRIFQVLTFLK